LKAKIVKKICLTKKEMEDIIRRDLSYIKPADKVYISYVDIYDGIIRVEVEVMECDYET
jgi:hypothetical protein